jgi:hypothetical protein
VLVDDDCDAHLLPQISSARFTQWECFHTPVIAFEPVYKCIAYPHRGPRPGRRKKCTPSLKTPRAFRFLSVLDLTLSNWAASKVVKYSTTATPPRK